MLKSRVFDILANDPNSTRAEVVRKICEKLDLTPNSSALKHAYADYKLDHNPLGEDQVGVTALLAASAGTTQ